MDPLLLGFLEASNDTDSQRELDQIVTTHVGPVVKVIVASKLRASPNAASTSGNDVQDLCNETLGLLILRLRELRTNPQANHIQNIKDFAARIAFAVCSEHFRHKFPERTRLRNRLRYLFTHHPDFKLSRGKNRRMVVSLCAPGLELVQTETTSKVRTLSQAARSVLQRLQNPADFHEVVSLMMDLLGIQDSPEILERIHETPPIEQITLREDLEKIWNEICNLPLKQRCALLFHLRDEQGNGVVTLLPVTNIASFRRIAEVLEISPEKLAALWNNFPLDDHAIAEYLGVSRQQVINLRKSARERLARKFGVFARR